MLIDQYQFLAYRTAKQSGDLTYDLRHAALGLATETGEFAMTVKRHAIYDAPLTAEMRGNLIEELGDLLWYVALAATALQIPLSEVAGGNIAKLRKCYPELYTNTLAEARLDKQGGRA